MLNPIDPGISTWPDENPQLIGGECGACGATVFPRQLGVPGCRKAEMSDALLPRRGTVVAWTTKGLSAGCALCRADRQGLRAVRGALVQLGDVVRVEGRLTENDPEKLTFGMEVELTMIPSPPTPRGTTSSPSPFSRFRKRTSHDQ